MGSKVRGLGAVLLIACLARPALAQPSEEDKNAARSLVQQGDALMKSQEYEGALKAYRRADDIMDVPTTAIEVGRLCLLLGKLVEASAAFKRAAAHPVRDGEPEPFTRARSDARELSRDLEARIPTVTISVKGLPHGKTAEVTVDGKPGETNTEIPLDPGEHSVAASASGYVKAVQSITLQEHDSRDVTLVLTEEKATLWPLAWTGFAVAGVGLVVGAVTGIISLNDAAEAKSFCNDANRCDPEAQEPLDRSRTLAHVSTTSFVVAGVGAALGIVGLVLSLNAESSASPSAAEVGIGLGGASVRLRF